MAVHAHPDDESSKGAASSARYVAEGERVMVVSCTGGERGDILNPRLRDDPEILRDLPAVRRQEMRTAQQILGVEHEWLGFVDSGLPQGDPPPPLPPGCFALQPLPMTTGALVELIRRFRPHVMTTYDEHGGYPHPDHIMCHRTSVAAFRAAGDGAAYPQAGPVWQPLKLYYNQTISGRRLEAIHRALLTEGIDSPYQEWIERRNVMPDRRITTHVPCAEHFGTRRRALLAHATQVDPDGMWFAASVELEQRVWPTEDFEVAISYVPIAADEDDLFAGLGDGPAADALARAAATAGRPPVIDLVEDGVGDELDRDVSDVLDTAQDVVKEGT